ncbi:MAG: PilZ domain-containing protein [Pseudomonadota bacterium]
MYDNGNSFDYTTCPVYRGEERRRFPRVRKELRVKYMYGDEYNIHSTVNVSQCGALIKSKSPIPVNSRVIIRIELPTSVESIVIISRVVRVEPGESRDFYYIALDFSIMNAGDNRKLAELITSIMKS